MKAFAQALDLKDDPKTIADYEQYHREVWPEVISDIRNNGISAMRIFRLGTHLFMYFEAPDDFDPQRDFQKYTRSTKSREWNELMMTFQQKVPEAGPNDWWAPMPLVFDMDWFK